MKYLIIEGSPFVSSKYLRPDSPCILPFIGRVEEKVSEVDFVNVFMARDASALKWNGPSLTPQ